VTAGRLIIVDDEPVILNLLTSIFADEPWDVVSCPDGSTAVAAMTECGVDVLLTDKNLPDIGGLELLRKAKELQTDCEGIIITGYASLDTVLAAMQLDAFDYIVKPPKDIFDVQRKVKQAFDKIRLGRENRRLMGRLTEQNGQLQAALIEIKKVQAELIQSEKLAGIGTLAAGVAHEISSPLFGVMGLAEAILDEDDPKLVREYAKEIVDYSGNIKDIVVELQGYSRTAEREYHTTVDLAQVVQDATRLVTRSLGIDAQRVVVEGKSGLHLNAKTSEIQQVFVNLIKNAVDAVSERHGEGMGRIEVRCWETGDWIHAMVKDDGPGISVERQSAIFDPFYTTKPPGRGTGLGLNIVYRIVTRYRGTIAVHSDPGQGARFELRFPREAD
jgi:C4-dicarboxylate-specific signal transduction histidine kinase